MVQTILGYKCGDFTIENGAFDPYSGDGFTHICDGNTANQNGTITIWCIKIGRIQVGSSATAKLKVFRVNGSNYDFVGESTEIQMNSENSIFGGDCNITVQSGDLIGVFLRTNSVQISGDAVGINKLAKSGDITTNTLITSWTTTDTSSFIGVWAGDIIKYFTRIASNGGSDSNDGLSWETPWATIDKAANTVLDGNEVQIEGGTYNAEPASNDIAPVNAGGIGIKYTVWGSASTGTNDGTGTGAVTVEKNT